MPRSPGTTTSPGATICPAPRPTAGGADAKAEARQTSSSSGFPLPNAPPMPGPEQSPATGRLISFSLQDTDKPFLPCTKELRAFSSPRGPPTEPLTSSQARCRAFLNCSRNSCARPWPSTTAPSSRATSACTDLHLKTYFCDTHSPWQKGGIENAIGRTRRFLPRKTNLAEISDRQFNGIIATYNNTPRKCLDFQTPAEVFLAQLLHFNVNPPPGFRRDDGLRECVLLVIRSDASSKKLCAYDSGFRRDDGTEGSPHELILRQVGCKPSARPHRWRGQRGRRRGSAARTRRPPAIATTPGAT